MPDTYKSEYSRASVPKIRKYLNLESNLDHEKRFILEDPKIYPHLHINVSLSCMMDVGMDDINANLDLPIHLLSGHLKMTMHLIFLFLKKIIC